MAYKNTTIIYRPTKYYCYYDCEEEEEEEELLRGGSGGRGLLLADLSIMVDVLKSPEVQTNYDSVAERERERERERESTCVLVVFPCCHPFMVQEFREWWLLVT